MEGIGKGASKMAFSFIISMIIFLILVIFSGRILNLINKSSCKKTDTNIEGAHKWAAWAVGISTLGLIISLGLLIAMYTI